MFWHVSVHPSVCPHLGGEPWPGPDGRGVPLPRGHPTLGTPFRPGWRVPHLGYPCQTWGGYPAWGVPHLGYNLLVLVQVTMRLVALLSVMLVLSGHVYGQTEHCCSPETFESDLRVSGELLGINLQVQQNPYKQFPFYPFQTGPGVKFSEPPPLSFSYKPGLVDWAKVMDELLQITKLQKVRPFHNFYRQH